MLYYFTVIRVFVRFSKSHRTCRADGRSSNTDDFRLERWELEGQERNLSELTFPLWMQHLRLFIADAIFARYPLQYYLRYCYNDRKWSTIPCKNICCFRRYFIHSYRLFSTSWPSSSSPLPTGSLEPEVELGRNGLALPETNVGPGNTRLDQKRLHNPLSREFRAFILREFHYIVFILTHRALRLESSARSEHRENGRIPPF